MPSTHDRFPEDELPSEKEPHQNPPQGARIIKRDLGAIDVGAGQPPAEIFTTSLEGDSREILKLKPTNVNESDEVWLQMVRLLGLFCAYSKFFQDFMQSGQMAGRILKAGGAKEAPGQFWEIYFGQAGKGVYSSLPIQERNIDGVNNAFLKQARSFSLEELGSFGQWMQEAGIHFQYAPAIIKAFLED